MSATQRLSRSLGSRRRQRRWAATLLVALLLAGFGCIDPAPAAADSDAGPLVLAHRGLGQTFDPDGIEADTCTAERIHPPEHGYLENTVAGMRAAFDAGADQVEFDVHWTADDQFAVFHDWELDCRTDGTGTTRDHTMAELRGLDIGYGYTADGGKSYPFRGKGVGLMPTLEAVLTAFPTRSLLIHIKSNDPAEGEALAARLAAEPAERRSALTVYGGDKPIAALRAALPTVRVMSKQIMLECLGAYAAVGWTGTAPATCRNTQLHIPEGYTRFLWGWPDRFVERMAATDARVVLVAGDGGFSEGFDTPESLERIPDGFTGLVWTNRADVVAPLLR
ncbi:MULTISPECIES: glycerophosphodiester phosphodiesterase family protein [unclassified Nocardia]|uniref:glycerophosphodiester phosphodiesterase family protein n=1 Tax=unclassified Nocardia TaxID=2637762 RepID=UPI00278C718E|nr:MULTISPECIES: glycerophosphodiester phosphodiesterase family protein [unclassified Nocardia]